MNYDADGNLISDIGRDGTDKVELTYLYTVENRLEAVYDKEIKYSSSIDPNVIKAMMYKESKMGYDPSTSPNANISRDVMQAIDIRNDNIFEYIKINLNNVRVATSKDKDENENYMVYGTRMDMGYSDISLDSMKIKEEYAILNRLFNTSIDGSGQDYDGNFESNQIYFYQYEEVTPFLSIAMGIDKLRREMDKAEDLYTAIYKYNTLGPEYPTDVLKIVNHDYVDLESEIK